MEFYFGVEYKKLRALGFIYKFSGHKCNYFVRAVDDGLVILKYRVS